ncbi:MAG: hypothetical protein OJF52_002844 [Nitrospira sp.]|jgi:hypothetical protein|nr:MAG: hypothetical protein OJF52_002844 [Nitrospira sp.]
MRSKLKIGLALTVLILASRLAIGLEATNSAHSTAAAELVTTPAVAPLEDPMNTGDIGVWTYIPEFSDWFNRVKMKEPGPTGAYAVNFQVWQVEELDRCVFNVFLDNQLPIDYPEGSIGVLPFTYPASWAFLKFSPADQQAVESAYLTKYREPRATLTHGGGKEPLTLYQARKMHFQRTAVVTLTIPCDRVEQLRNPLTLHIRTTTGTMHEVRLPDHFLAWMQWNLKKWRRSEAKTSEEGLTDHNVWSYSAGFAKRFGLRPLNEPPLAGADAIAFRVERYEGDERTCLLDLYLDDSVPILLPEGEAGSIAVRPHFLYSRGKTEVEQSKPVKRPGPSYTLQMGSARSELFAIRELRTEREQRTFPMKRLLEGNLFRVSLSTPLHIYQYRKHVFPGVSYLSLDLGCSLPVPEKGPAGVAILREDGSLYDISFTVPFMQRAQRQLQERVVLPFKRQFPKMYPNIPGN